MAAQAAVWCRRAMSSIPAKLQNKYLDALRQLALTAPGGRMSLIEGTRLIQQVVPVDNTTTFWINDQYKIVDLHNEINLSLSVVQDYQENFLYSTQREDGGLSVKDTQTSGAPITIGSQHRNEEIFCRSELYNRIFKPANLGWVISIPLRHADGSPFATPNMGRALDSANFNQDEIDFVLRARPWLEYLARKEHVAAHDERFFSSGESATLHIDAAGKILSASNFALSLMHQAANTPLTDAPLKQTLQGDIRMLLRHFGQSVVAAMNNYSVAPPSITVNNRWGQFHLQAYVLRAFEAGMPMQISVRIERKVPLSLRIFGLPKFLDLSPREREVCLLMIAGLDRNEIAQKIGVKPSTIVYFTRQLYRRLDINQQSELLDALTRETV
jgi:DNA-binding CsgD family transcriptional regulator